MEGLDSISVKVLAPYVHKPLTYIVNLSIRQSIFASRWKIAKLIPVHKGKKLPTNLPSSFRPVSLLPTVSKLVERVVAKQIMSYMIRSKQLNISQHAYRSNHGTSSAICQLLENLYEATDSNQIATILAVDQSAAFDTVKHEYLIKKLGKYNCGENTLKWITSYLSFRSQYVHIGGKSSMMKPVHSGVPQGSIIGPLLYIIYTNELCDVMRVRYNCQHLPDNQDFLFGHSCNTCGAITGYADDTTLISKSNSRGLNQTKLKEGLDSLEKFITTNCLAINRSKTTIAEVMVGQKRVKTAGSPPTLEELDKDGKVKVIKCIKEVRLLGTTIQDNLSWGAHLESGSDALLPQVRKSIGILKHIGKIMPTRSKKLVAEGIILSRLIYMIAIWGGTTIRNTEKAQALVNNVARFITGKGKKTSTLNLMK